MVLFLQTRNLISAQIKSECFNADSCPKHCLYVCSAGARTALCMEWCYMASQLTTANSAPGVHRAGICQACGLSMPWAWTALVSQPSMLLPDLLERDSGNRPVCHVTICTPCMHLHMFRDMAAGRTHVLDSCQPVVSRLRIWREQCAAMPAGSCHSDSNPIAQLTLETRGGGAARRSVLGAAAGARDPG